MFRRALKLTLLSIIIALALFNIPADALRRAPVEREAGVRLSVPAPEDVLGFRPGDDRKLASWRQVIEYFKRLDAASDRVKFEELGKSTMGQPFVMAIISAPENLARLDEHKRIQEQLADPRRLGEDADRKADKLIKRGKTVVLITCGIHSDEVGSYLSSMLIAYRLASSDDAQVRKILSETIVLLVPSLNPDGVDIIKDWYDKTLGTPYEGTEPPVLYHKYTGHDDNRDWYAFTQAETQLTVDKIHNVWHPQIVNDIHQQGENGARLFLPPYMEPVEPNVPKQIVEGYTELGTAIAKEMRAAGFKGITTNTTYDAWTPSRAYSHYHGGVRILSETASCKLATPVTIKFEYLRGSFGYDARKETDKFSPLWPGGEWHLRDITNYMTAAAFSLMTHAAENRERWLRRFYELGKEAVRPRQKGELYGFEITPSNGNILLDYILRKGGVEVDYGEPLDAGKRGAKAVRGYIRMAQPYGAFAKALLEKQQYPDLRDPAGHPIAPYDVTGHTLSLLMGVEVTPAYAPFRYKKITFDDEGELAAYDSDSKLAVYKSHIPAIDEGWTRWALEQNGRTHPSEFMYDIRRTPPFFSLEDREAQAGNLNARYNVIIIPDQSPRAILEGHPKGTMPDEYTGGLGAEGVKALREFVEAGGTLVCLNRASDFAIEQLKLPVRDITAGLKRTEFYAPGSILRTELDTSNPLAKGMPRESIAWVENSPVFELSDEKEAARVRIIARYPADKDPLLSGWLLGGERLRGKAALVEVALGKGRVILFGFRPQYRGQSVATYPLFFNALKN